MEAFWFQLLTLLILLHRTMSDADAEELIRAESGSVTFRIPNPTGDAAFWQFESDPIVSVKFGYPPQALFSEKKYKTRFSISEDGMALSISPLSMEDAGTYSVKVGGKKSTFTLQVFRELAEPTVSCESRNCSAGSCSFSLLCSSPGVGVGNVTYTWSLGKQVWDEGPSVWVEKSPQEELEPLRCTVRNAVSSRNVTVTSLEKFCADNSTHLPGPDALSRNRLGIGIVVGIGVAVLLGFCLLFFCKSKGWQKFHFSKSGSTCTEPAAEYTTVYAQVGPSPQCIPNGTRNGTAAKPAQAADEDSSKTIYSLVKRPAGVDHRRTENAQSSVLELV